MGKHVYVEKPMAHTIHEARVMGQVAKEMGVATQMGNQGTSSDSLRQGVEIIQSGAIGEVREVHVWTNRPVWPQYTEIPTDQPPVPKGLDWDLWLGPLRWRPYNARYCHGSFRWFLESGGGQIRDRGAHVMSCAMWWMGADGTGPVEVEATGEAPRKGLWDSAVKISVKYTFKDPDWVLTWNQLRK